MRFVDCRANCPVRLPETVASGFLNRGNYLRPPRSQKCSFIPEFATKPPHSNQLSSTHHQPYVTMSSALITLLGDELLTKDGVQPTSKVLADKKIVGIYFSAHWCPPCRAFTPVLSTTYEELVEEHPEVEIIFVSSDREEPAFTEYFGEMSFKALPYEQRERKAELSTKFEVKFIPTLVFVNDKGEVVTSDGRNVVANAEGDIEKIWEQLTVQH